MTYEDVLTDLAKKDDRLVVLTAENRAPIRNAPKTLTDRFIDTGITEQAMIGTAAGLALRGRIPVAHALATFLVMRAYEFIRTDVGIGNLCVKLTGYVPGFLSEANGPTHQAIEDISLLRTIPRMGLFCPADEDDLVKGLSSVLLDPNPFYIRYNIRKPVVEHAPFVPGKAEVFGNGTDVALVTYGTLFTECYQAKEILEKKGLNVRLIHLRTLKPLDENTLLAASRECSLIVTVEDHFLTGGLYTILSEVLLRNELTAKVLPLALDNHWFKPALLPDVLEYEGFTAPKIAERVLGRLAQKEGATV